jgi:hypothetical protein
LLPILAACAEVAHIECGRARSSPCSEPVQPLDRGGWRPSRESADVNACRTKLDGPVTKVPEDLVTAILAARGRNIQSG